MKKKKLIKQLKFELEYMRQFNVYPPEMWKRMLESEKKHQKIMKARYKAIRDGG